VTAPEPRLCARPGCTRHAHPDGNLCGHDVWQLGRHLTSVADLVDELDTARYGATASIWPPGGAGTGEAPLPFDPRAEDAEHDLHLVLDLWAARLEDDGAGQRPGATAALAGWLYERRYWLAARDDAAAAYAAIAGAVKGVTRVVDRPPEKRYTGTCSCGQQLYARAGDDTVSCARCSTPHDTAEARRRLGAQLDGQLMTGAEIARLAQYFGHIAERERARNLIKVWAARGLLAAHGHKPGGDPLYPFGETLQLLLTRKGDRVLPSVSAGAVSPEPGRR